MTKKAGTKLSRAGCGAATAAGPSQVEQPAAGAASAALLALAEELGRLLARRELTAIRNRRGYTLPELLLGLSVMVVVWILIAGALSWILP